MNKFISKIVVLDPNEGTGYSLYNLKDIEARRDKADKSDVYTKDEVDNKINDSKLPTITTYEIDVLINN